MTTKTKVQTKKDNDTLTKKTSGTSNKTSQKNKPTEEQIRRKAQEIYYQRQNKGEYGTEIDDWQKAEQILSKES